MYTCQIQRSFVHGSTINNFSEEKKEKGFLRLNFTFFLLPTVYLSTWIVGLAEGYSRNIRFMPTPDKIPYSTPMMRQNKKVTNIGTRSFLLDFHINFTTSYSIMYITAQMITADNEAGKKRRVTITPNWHSSHGVARVKIPCYLLE